MTLFPGTVGANFGRSECLTGGCRASSHPALAGGSGLGSALPLGYRFWQEGTGVLLQPNSHTFPQLPLALLSLK